MTKYVLCGDEDTIPDDLKIYSYDNGLRLVRCDSDEEFERAESIVKSPALKSPEAKKGRFAYLDRIEIDGKDKDALKDTFDLEPATEIPEFIILKDNSTEYYNLPKSFFPTYFIVSDKRIQLLVMGNLPNIYDEQQTRFCFHKADEILEETTGTMDRRAHDTIIYRLFTGNPNMETAQDMLRLIYEVTGHLTYDGVCIDVDNNFTGEGEFSYGEAKPYLLSEKIAPSEVLVPAYKNLLKLDRILYSGGFKLTDGRSSLHEIGIEDGKSKAPYFETRSA